MGLSPRPPLSRASLAGVSRGRASGPPGTGPRGPPCARGARPRCPAPGGRAQAPGHGRHPGASDAIAGKQTHHDCTPAPAPVWGAHRKNPHRVSAARRAGRTRATCLPPVLPGQGLRAASRRTRAHRRTGPTPRRPLRSRSVALPPLRRGVHRPSAPGDGRNQVRRDRAWHDRAAEIRRRHAILPPRRPPAQPRDSAAHLDPVGSRPRGVAAAPSGLRRTHPPSRPRRHRLQRRHHDEDPRAPRTAPAALIRLIQPPRCVHLRHRLHPRRGAHRTVFHRPSTRRRKPRRGPCPTARRA